MKPGGNGGLASVGALVHFLVKAVKTLCIALLFGFPVLGNAAEDWPASNWLWQLPPERSFSDLLTDDEFWRAVRQIEDRRDEFRSLLDAKSRLSDPSIEPPRNGQSIEAAEILNSLRMDRYREECEKVKQSELQGTPALYPTQIPLLENR